MANFSCLKVDWEKFHVHGLCLETFLSDYDLLKEACCSIDELKGEER